MSADRAQNDRIYEVDTTSESAWQGVRHDLDAVAARFVALLRSVSDPEAKALGEWSIGETAAHVRCVSALNSLFASGDGPPDDLRDMYTRALGVDIETVALNNDFGLEWEEERDPRLLADRIEAGVARLLDVTAGAAGHEEVTWLGGMKLPLIAIGSHMLTELLVHGHDIARAEGRTFPISDENARPFFEHQLPSTVKAASATGFLSGSRSDMGPLTWEFRLRGSAGTVFALTDGELTMPAPGTRSVDLHISARPAAMLLVMWGRRGRIVPALQGHILVWGRRPWRLGRLMKVLQLP
jgi:hypothetical protein